MTQDGRTQTFQKHIHLSGVEQARPPRATPEMLEAMGFGVNRVPKKKVTKRG